MITEEFAKDMTIELISDENIEIVDATDGHELTLDEKKNINDEYVKNYEVRYKGKEAGVVDDEDGTDSSDSTFNDLLGENGDTEMSAYLAGYKHKYNLGSTTLYFN